MKTYESDGNLNYDDLSNGSVGEVKGYGPCVIVLRVSVFVQIILGIEGQWKVVGQ
jgi:hypothetical protein